MEPEKVKKKETGGLLNEAGKVGRRSVASKLVCRQGSSRLVGGSVTVRLPETAMKNLAQKIIGKPIKKRLDISCKIVYCRQDECNNKQF